jgi:hypothetical protein
MATDMLARIVYVPSEHNPADQPSRGEKRRRSQGTKVPVKSKQSRVGTRLDRYIEQTLRANDKFGFSRSCSNTSSLASAA